MLIKDLDQDQAIRVEESWIDSGAIRRGGILGRGLFSATFIYYIFILPLSVMFFHTYLQGWTILIWFYTV